MDVSGGGVVNGLLFSQTGDQMADVAGALGVPIHVDGGDRGLPGDGVPSIDCERWRAAMPVGWCQGGTARA